MLMKDILSTRQKIISLEYQEVIDMYFSINQAQDYCKQPPGYPLGMELAHAYVPFQQLDSIYPPEKGFKQGTIFPGLDRPYGVDPEYTVDH